MDQKIFRSDGTMNPNVRLVLKTDDEDLFICLTQGLDMARKRYGADCERWGRIHRSIIFAHRILKHLRRNMIGSTE